MWTHYVLCTTFTIRNVSNEKHVTVKLYSAKKRDFKQIVGLWRWRQVQVTLQ